MKKAEITAFDRVLLSVVPDYALSRIRARAAVRHYEAAQPGRRTENWRRTSGDADFLLRFAARELRVHARDLARNNGWARRGVKVIANNAVGWGIKPKATGSDAGVNTRAMELWNAWAGSTECESDNRMTFAGIQHLAMRSLVTDGEVMIRRRIRRAKDELTIPLQLQVLEADYLDTGKSDITSLAGGPVIQGIEFDKIGARAAYWLFQQHPGSGRNYTASVRIPASEIIHLYDVDRPGQSRGVSWLATAIINLKDLDEYDDAELMKQKIAALFAAFISDTEGAGAPQIGDQESTDPKIETMEPGTVIPLPPGQTVTMANPPTLTSDSLATRTLRRVAAGLGVTFEDLTGDYSMVNFSSARMARISHWGNVHQWQQNLLIPILCARVWAWAMEAAVLASEIPEAPPSSWTCPPIPLLDPEKEALGITRMIRSGIQTLSGAIREQGEDPEAHLAEYAADMKKLDELKIVLDSDVRAVSQAGLTQVRAGVGGDAPKAAAAANEAPRTLSQFADVIEAIALAAHRAREREAQTPPKPGETP